MTEENKQPIQNQEEIDHAWYELWQFALNSIRYGESYIEYDDFIEEGKKQFEIKLKECT